MSCSLFPWDVNPVIAAILKRKWKRDKNWKWFNAMVMVLSPSLIHASGYIIFLVMELLWYRWKYHIWVFFLAKTIWPYLLIYDLSLYKIYLMILLVYHSVDIKNGHFWIMMLSKNFWFFLNFRILFFVS